MRKLTWQGSVDYVTDAAATTVLNREASALFRIDFHTSDQLMVEYVRDYERLPVRFPIAPGVVVPAGGYDYDTSRVTYVLGQQRKLSGRLSAAAGTLYGGTKSEVTYQRALGRRAAVLDRAGDDDRLRCSCRYGDFTARLVNSRFTLTPSARMLISSLVQY